MTQTRIIGKIRLDYLIVEQFVEIQIDLNPWYEMVAQNTLRKHEVKKSFPKKKIGFDDLFENAFNKSKYMIYYIYEKQCCELPYNKSTKISIWISVNLSSIRISGMIKLLQLAPDIVLSGLI